MQITRTKQEKSGGINTFYIIRGNKDYDVLVKANPGMKNMKCK